MNKQTLPYKTYYFFIFAALAALAPYLTVYYADLGLNGRQIGILAALPSLITFVSSPLFGAVTDVTRRQNQVLGISILGVAFGVIGISLVEKFVGLLPVVLMYAFFFGPLIPLIDRSVLDFLGTKKYQYGKIRLWGAIGWGVSAPLVGVFAEQFGVRWAFYIGVFFFMILLGVSRAIQVEKVQLSSSFFKGVQVLAASRQVVFFFIIILIGGMGLAVVHHYLFLYLSGLGASPVMMGWALTIATVSELVVMYYSERLLKMWQTRGLILFGLFMIMLRLLGYAFVQSPVLALALQLLHGPTFAALWIAGVAYVAEIAPPGLGHTVQGLFSGVIQGLGSALGAFLGGFLFQLVGFASMFSFMSVAVGLGMLLFWIVIFSQEKNAAHND